MRLFFASIKVAFKRYLTVPICAVLLSYIIIFSVYIVFVNTLGVEAISIGLFSEAGQNDVIDRFFESLGGIAHVEYYDNLDAMIEDIEKNKIQTGYALSERRDYKYDAYRSDRATATSISNFLFSAIATQSVAGEKGYEVIRNLAARKGLDKDFVVREVEDILNKNLAGATGEVVAFEDVNELPFAVNEAEDMYYTIVHFLWWSLVFVVLSLDALRLNKGRYSAGFKAMKINTTLYLSGQLTGTFIISAMFFTLSVLVLRFI